MLSLMAQFKHVPLPNPSVNFRVVAISPVSPDNVIRCNLRTIHIGHDKQSYHALSYLWGEESPKHEIQLDGRSYEVRQNLYDFLSHAQDRFPGLPIFIDAICINQGNLHERNQQVQMMGGIYENCKLAICWLGPGNRFVDGALPLIKELSGKTSQELSHLHDGPDRREKQKVWSSIYMLFDLKYWSRVWIIQEILKPSTVLLMCGRHELDWMEMSTFFDRIKAAKPCPAPLQEDLFSSRAHRLDISRDQDEDGWMRYTLLSFSSSQCSEMRDRIYALLSLGKDGDTFRVDYSIPLDQLFLKAVQLWGAQNGANALILAKHLVDLLIPYTATVPKLTGYSSSFVMKLIDTDQVQEHGGCSRQASCQSTLKMTYQIPAFPNTPLNPAQRGFIQDGSPLENSQIPISFPSWIMDAIKIETIKNSQMRCSDKILQISDTTMFLVIRPKQSAFEIAGLLSVVLEEIEGVPKIVSQWLPWSKNAEKQPKLIFRGGQHYQISFTPFTFRAFLAHTDLELTTMASNYGGARVEIMLEWLRWAGGAVTWPLQAIHQVQAIWRGGQSLRSEDKTAGLRTELSLGQVYQALKTSTLNMVQPEEFKATPSWKELLGRT